MSAALRVLELNDHGVTLGDAAGVQVVSPGFALARDKELIFGKDAQAQSRLHPNHSHSRFWQALSVEPLPEGSVPTGRVRHLADLAYAQLQAIAAEAGLTTLASAETLLSVPSSFSREQLGILLGVAKQTPFRVVGLVDSALLSAATSQPDLDPLIVVQQQLYQTVFTFVRASEGKLQVESSLALASTGSQNVLDALMQLSTDLFIDQCRFNPQHDAVTEQGLYNALPEWLRADVQDGNLALSLAADGAVHNATLPYESLVAALAPTRQRVHEQILGLNKKRPAARIVLCPLLGRLPGLREELTQFAPCDLADSSATLHAGLRYAPQLLAAGASGLCTALTLADSPASLPTVPEQENLAITDALVESLSSALRARATIAEGEAITVELESGVHATLTLKRGQHGED